MSTTPPTTPPTTTPPPTPPPPPSALSKEQQDLINKSKQLRKLHNNLEGIRKDEIAPALIQVSAHRTGVMPTAKDDEIEGSKALRKAYSRFNIALHDAVGVRSGIRDFDNPDYHIDKTAIEGHKAGEFIGGSMTLRWVLGGTFLSATSPPVGYKSLGEPDTHEAGFTPKIAAQLDQANKAVIAQLEAGIKALTEKSKIATLDALEVQALKDMQDEISALKNLKFEQLAKQTDTQVGAVDKSFLQREQQGAVDAWLDAGRHSEKETGVLKYIFDNSSFQAHPTSTVDEDGNVTLHAHVDGIPFFGEAGKIHAYGHLAGSYYEAMLQRGKLVTKDKMKDIPDPANAGKTIQVQDIDPATGKAKQIPDKDADGKVKYVAYTSAEAADLVKENPFPLESIPGAYPGEAYLFIMNAVAVAESMGGTIKGYNPDPNPATNPWHLTGGFDPAQIDKWEACIEDPDQKRYFRKMMGKGNIENGLAAAKARVHKNVIETQIEDMVLGELDPAHAARSNMSGFKKRVSEFFGKTPAAGEPATEATIQAAIQAKKEDYRQASSSSDPAEQARALHWRQRLTKDRYFDSSTTGPAAAGIAASLPPTATPPAIGAVLPSTVPTAPAAGASFGAAPTSSALTSTSTTPPPPVSASKSTITSKGIGGSPDPALTMTANVKSTLTAKGIADASAQLRDSTTTNVNFDLISYHLSGGTTKSSGVTASADPDAFKQALVNDPTTFAVFQAELKNFPTKYPQEVHQAAADILSTIPTHLHKKIT